MGSLTGIFRQICVAKFFMATILFYAKKVKIDELVLWIPDLDFKSQTDTNLSQRPIFLDVQPEIQFFFVN